MKGRGATENPPNRFERLRYKRENDEEGPAPTTQFYRDTTTSLIAYNQSPDVGFSASINVYRGCEHG